MRKILMLLLVLFCFIFIPKVKAQEFKLTKIDQSGIYFVREGGTVPDKTAKFSLFYLGDNLVYCIDPARSINTDYYVSDDGYVDLPFSRETLEKLELYGYYGREYPGHDTIRYSMATQALIWEEAGGQTVTFYTRPYGGGDVIDISKEKNEIKSLVEKHRILPDLPANIYADSFHEIIIEDKNGVLDNFELRDYQDMYEAYIENNRLHIRPHDQGTYILYLQRKKYDNLDTMIFVGSDDVETQTLGRLRFSDLSQKEITLSVDGPHLFVHKIDENDSPVEINAINFKIKNLNTGEYVCDRYDCIFETDFDGVFSTNGLDIGDYEIEEVENQIIKGYSWNSEKVLVHVSEEEVKWNKDRQTYLDAYFQNKSVTASLEVHKKGEKTDFSNNDITYQEINLGNISFDLYDEKNNLIKTIVTDSNGYVKVDNLKVGKYCLQEKTNIYEYIPNTNKICFEIKQDNPYQEHINYVLNVNNYLKKGKLEFNKIDNITSEGISDTVMEIYNENNELLLTKTTDEKGKIIINNLPIGKYYLKEKEANYYYQKSSDKIEFEIKENDDVVKKTMTNEKIMGTLLLTKFGEVFKIDNNEIKYDMNILSDIEFELYDMDNNLIEVLKTNEDGTIKKELPLGKYYLIEKTKINEYIDNNEKYYFEIKKDGNDGCITKLSIDNYLKKGNLEFDKLDITTSIGIPDTTIELYNIKDELLLTRKTNELGKINITNLPIGEYYIVEKEANLMYLLTNEKVYFTVKENNELVNAKMTNERITVPVPKTKTNESVIAHTIAGICLFVGFGGLYFERKKTT